MGEQAVGPIEAHRPAGDAGAGPPSMPCVNRVISGPAVVGGPGQVAALKEQIAGAVVAYDEDDVTLDPGLLCCQLPQVDAAQPILGDFNLDRRLPIAFADIVFTHRRIGLDFAFERLKGTH